MGDESWNLLLAREHEHDLQMRIRYQGGEQVREQVAGLGIESDVGIVQDEHTGTVHQGLDQLELAELATGEQHDVLVQKGLHAEQGEKLLYPRLVVGFGQEFAHQRRGLHVLRVPSLLVIMRSVGIAIRIAERDVSDIVADQRR